MHVRKLHDFITTTGVEVEFSFHNGWNEYGTKDDKRAAVDISTANASFLLAEDLREIADELERYEAQCYKELASS